MNQKDRFFNNRQHLNDRRDEMERQWRVFQEEQQMIELFEQAARNAQSSSAQGFGVAGGSSQGTNNYIEDYVDDYFL